VWLRLYRAFAQLLLSEMWRTNREWRQTVTLLREEVVGAIAEVLRAGVASGEFDPDLDVEIAASALFGVVLVVAVDWLVFSPQRPVEEVHQALLGIVSSRLGTPGRPGLS
jgi:hypothetical protein